MMFTRMEKGIEGAKKCAEQFNEDYTNEVPLKDIEATWWPTEDVDIELSGTVVYIDVCTFSRASYTGIKQFPAFANGEDVYISEDVFLAIVDG